MGESLKIQRGVSSFDADATSSDILSPKIAYVNNKKVIGEIPTKTASSLTASGPTVTVPAGYYASNVSKSVTTATQATPSLSIANSTGIVTATATQSAGYVVAGSKSATLQLTTQAAQTITPGTSNKTIAANRWLTGTQTIAGDADLIASNIKSGVNIFGVTGSFGGFISSWAIVDVLAPTGSTVSLSKSGSTTKTITSANATINNTDTTMRNYYFFFTADEYGTWTATGTKDGQTVLKTITVNAIRKYDLTLVYWVYLFKKNEGFKAFNGTTYALHGYGYAGGTSRDRNLTMDAATGSIEYTGWSGYGHIAFTSALDLTGYTKINMHFHGKMSSGTSNMVTAVRLSTYAKPIDNAATNAVASTSVSLNTTNTERTVSVDITNVATKTAIYFAADAKDSMVLSIHDIYVS